MNKIYEIKISRRKLIKMGLSAGVLSSMPFGFIKISVNKLTELLKFVSDPELPVNENEIGQLTDSEFNTLASLCNYVNDITQNALHAHKQNLINVLKATGCEEDSIHTGTIKPDGAHATSTCRMSSSDPDGVVNKNLKVHGTDNLYVCSNAVYPNVTAVNPTLTVAALAIRLADHSGT